MTGSLLERRAVELLIDNALSPRVAEELRSRGYDCLHVRDLGLSSAADAEIFEEAHRQRRVLISRDGDFSTLLANTGFRKPSFVHLRSPGLNHPADQVEAICAAVSSALGELAVGAIVTVRGDRIRVRKLPIDQR